MKKICLLAALGLLGLAACKKNDAKTDDSDDADSRPLFTLLPGSQTGITFRNDLRYDENFNIHKYRNFYNGGGVAIGDVNNDGLPDIFFTSNMASNKLYLNRGNWHFEDATERARVGGSGAWSTGVAMADVNADGWLDIYVCNSGNPQSVAAGQPFSRKNELFINNGNGTFSEKASEYGLADGGLSTHAAFFDYDRDGDLDAYVLNNSFQSLGKFNLDQNLRFTRDSLGGHKLYRNEGPPSTGAKGQRSGGFTDVSSEAGILGSVIAFGLGVTVADLNHDGWQDIYVSNDFFERDYLYFNQKNGRFSEELPNAMRHVSASSMGADIADVNNDGHPDVFVTDMLPEDDRRLKTTTAFDTYDRFQYLRRAGYFNQFTRNTLQLNNLNGTFSEIACLAGVEATDWSWGALIFDMDNDGWKDIFVANGIAQDLSDQDYLAFASGPDLQRELLRDEKNAIERLLDSMPSEKLPNYAFRNAGDLTFKNVARRWGLATPSFSNGSAYGDLDNDGDLDLVVNNVGMEAFVYRNETDKTLKTNRFLKFELSGGRQNLQAFGAKIFVRAAGRTHFLEQMPMRGFQSSMDARPVIGLGSVAVADSVVVEFLSGKTVVLTRVPTNQVLKISEKDAAPPVSKPWLDPPGKPFFEKSKSPETLPFVHRENKFNDFDRDRLLFFMHSTEGPRLAVGDLNGDGRDDVFACGAKNQASAVMLQTADAQFVATKQPALQADRNFEDVDAALFDADGDGDLDLFVASGGNDHPPGSTDLADRLYLNNGKGNFSKKINALPARKPYASGCVRAADFDADGDVDLFVGMRLMPGRVGVPMDGFLMKNDGSGNFSPVETPVLKRLGMMTDACWTDFDADGDPDLLVVGEWMPVRVFRNDGGQLRDATASAGLEKSSGLWRRIAPGDFDGDGRTDFLLGNHGLNSRLDASPERPISLFYSDFDKNGLYEQMLCRYENEALIPYTMRPDLVGNVPGMRKKYQRFGQYAEQKITDIFKPEQLAEAIESQAGELGSAVLMNLGGGKFALRRLPNEAQFSPMLAVCVGDFDGDGHADAVSGGNLLGVKPEFGYEDADYGLFLKGDGRGNFQPLRSASSGLFFEGEIRDVVPIKIGKKRAVLVAQNDGPVRIYYY